MEIMSVLIASIDHFDLVYPSRTKMLWTLPVPMKNPGRYFEQFVKIVQPIGEAGQTRAASTQDWSQTRASQTRSQKESTNTGFVMKN